MDTEKIKQMGRDYFTANPEREMIYLNDRSFMGLRGSTTSSLLAIEAWELGWKEAAYAASKEGRAIELLGRMQVAQERGGIDALTWQDVGKFLEEIGWKPNA